MPEHVSTKKTRAPDPPRKMSNDSSRLDYLPPSAAPVLRPLLRRLGVLLLGLSLVCGLRAGPVAAQAPTCSATDVAVTAVITDATDTAGRTALAGDCAILLDMKDTLLGMGTASLNWATSLSMASWDGISVTGSRVTRLNLSQKQLTGTIPAALSGLTNLDSLDLGSNQLTGAIPDLSALTNLTNLRLNTNQLSGAIPATLSALTNLQKLHLQDNQLSGTIPAALSGLTNLEDLFLNTNQLTGTIPAALSGMSGLTSLQYLLLSGNQLSGTIPNLSALTNLQQLHLSDNELTGTIPALSALTNLTQIDLKQNQLSGAIPALSALTNLQQLHLSDNELSGTIPALSALTNLHNLQLDNNQLSGSIPALSSLTSLEILYLHNNELSGSIPDLSGLSSLEILFLYNNELSGSIPDLSSLSSLTQLLLNRNQLSGSIPDLSALSSLRWLYLYDNELSGSIPATVGSLASLQGLLLADNLLTGGIPSQLGSLTSLTWLSLCGTTLDATATLPSALETRRTGGQLTVWSCVHIQDASADEGTALSFPVEHDTTPVRGVATATGGLTLSYETADGTATSADYTGTSMGSVTIPANTDPMTTSSSAPISVPTTADSAADADETLTVTLLSGWPASGVHPLRRTATGTITEPVVSALSIGDASAVEGTALTFAVTLSPSASQEVTVAWATGDGTASAGTDYTASSGTLRFAAGTTRQTFSVPTLGNALDEADRTFSVTLSGATGGATIADATGIGTIRDDDEPPVVVSVLSIGDASAVEGTALTFAVTLSPSASQEVTVAWATGDGTASAGTDYTASSGTLRFAAGTTRQTFSVPTLGNALDEADRTFSVTLSGATGGATIADATGIGTIRDDDEPPVVVSVLSIGDASAVEGTALTFAVTLSPSASQEVTVAWATGDGTASAGTDYTASSGTLRFAAGTTRQTFSVPTLGNALDEADRTFSVTLSGATGGATIADATGIGTIRDDEAPAALSMGNASAVEGVPLTFAVLLSPPASQEVTVMWATGDRTARAGTDYTTGSGTLRFAAGTTRQTFSVPTLDNARDEPARTFSVTLSGATGGATIADATGIGTIRDDDALAALSIEDASAVEGTALTFAVTLSPSASQEVTVAWATEDGTASAGTDYPASSGTLRFAAGTTRQTFRVPTLDNAREEAARTFSVTLSGATGGATIADATGIGTIRDDDAPGGGGGGGGGGGSSAALSIGDASAVEGGLLTFAVTLSPSASQEVTVRWRTRDRTARAGTDYPADSGTLRFAAGTTRQTITVPTHDNAWDEPDRAFRVTLSGATGGAQIRDATGIGTIQDDDAPSAGRLEVPARGAVQSGVGVLSGWLCEARRVQVEFVTPGQPVSRVEAAYGTERADTASECGDVDNGFSLLWNWNLLGAGAHTVRLLVDGQVWITRRVTVTTLGEEFRRGLAGTYAVADFPTEGERVTVRWQEAQQNFVIAGGEAPAGTQDTGSDFPHSVLENPPPGSFQSGIDFVSGWVCDADAIAVEFRPEDGAPWRAEAAYGTVRGDTAEAELAGETVEVCGDTDNGFGLLVNWNHLGDGVHTVVVRADGEEIGRRTVRVTTLGAEFRRGLSGTYTLADFPAVGETVTIAWQESQQNFVITDWE